jgi:predicted Zn-dependent protease
MDDRILNSLRRRTELLGWTLRRATQHTTQLFSVGPRIEAERNVAEERTLIDVLMPGHAPDGSPACGMGNATLLPHEPVEPAIDRAIEMATHVHNPVHGLPARAQLPDVPLEDKRLVDRPMETLRAAHEALMTLASRRPEVRVTAAEWHARTRETQLLNSRGQEGSQRETTLLVEWVLVTGEGEARAENFVGREVRRMADLAIEAEFQRQADMAIDRQQAGPAPNWDGKVVLRDAVLATFLNGGPIQFLGSAANRYAQLTSWEIDKSVLRREGAGDPFTVYASRILPYGIRSSRMDSEGIPGQRVLLVADSVLKAFSAGQRYAEYLALPATGEFGDLEVPPGSTASAELLEGPHIEVAAFSWFNPDSVTGDFATEIRLGYLVENGNRTPFRGGMLIGNFLDALGDARWSRETGFYSEYRGPTAVRLTGLKVAGRTAG